MDKIIQRPGLDNDELRSLWDLSYRACLKDQELPPLYWHLIKQKRVTEGDLLYMKGYEQLVGYLGFFLFEEKTAEITAVVSPEHRRHGIFSELLDHAQNYLIQEGIEIARLKAPSRVVATQKTLTRLNASYDSSEYRLQLSKVKGIGHSPFALSRASSDEIDDIIELSQGDKLNSTETELLRHYFQRILEEEDRMALIGHERHKAFAKIHARFEEDTIVLHDIAFSGKPRYSGQFHEFIQRALQEFRKCSNKPFSILLQEEQLLSMQLLSESGFRINQVNEYWTIPIADHERIVRRTDKLIN